MPQLTTQQALEVAQQELKAGRIAQSQSICRQILTHEPRNVGAIQLAAQLAFMSGDAGQSVALLRQAIALDPRNPHNFGNLGSVLAQVGCAQEAIDAFRQALSINPRSIETHANLATALAGLGRTDEAIDVCHQALNLDPNAVGVLNNLANAQAAKGDLEAAIATIKRAVEIAPTFVEGRNNLGNLLRKAERPGEALPHFIRFAELRPDLAEAHAGVAATLLELGRIDDAIRGFKATLEMFPGFARGAFGLGFVYKSANRLDDSIEAFRRATQIDPDYADAYLNLGLTLAEKGDSAGAIEAYNKVIAINPKYAEAYNNLAVALLYQQRSAEVIDVIGKALELQPDYPGALNNLALAYEDLGRQDEALDAYQRAVRMAPDLELVCNNYGNALRESGRISDAVKQFRSILSRRPSALAAGNLLFAIHAHPEFTAEAILDEHRKWESQYALPLRGMLQSYPNSRDPERRIRIGLVSGDFNQHPVGRFLQPLFVNHDVDRFEFYCYSEGRRHDVSTDLLRKHADHWRSTIGSTDEQVVAQVRSDQIDILIDLAMHTKDSRLMIFARKPAPVQVTYLAYAGTTGLSAIDYRLTDVYLDPPGQNDELYVEKSVRLPHSYWCYEALPEAAALTPQARPADAPITFGSLNNFWKVNPSVLEVWREIFSRLPGSRLIIHAREGSHREQLLKGLGVDASRVQFEPRTGPAKYFSLYHEIDVALDPFPYPGGTTSCDALYMGVPVVTLAGKAGVSRGGVSILSNVGLPEFIARDKDEYVRIATQIARDASRRASLRTMLRKQMQDSPLMNAKQFTADVESALKWMWRQWCEDVETR